MGNRTKKPAPPKPGEFEVGDLVQHVNPVGNHSGLFRVYSIYQNKKGDWEVSVYGGDNYLGNTKGGRRNEIYVSWRTFYKDDLVFVRKPEVD